MGRFTDLYPVRKRRVVFFCDIAQFPKARIRRVFLAIAIKHRFFAVTGRLPHEGSPAQVAKFIEHRVHEGRAFARIFAAQHRLLVLDHEPEHISPILPVVRGTVGGTANGIVVDIRVNLVVPIRKTLLGARLAMLHHNLDRRIRLAHRTHARIDDVREVRRLAQ